MSGEAKASEELMRAVTPQGAAREWHASEEPKAVPGGWPSSSGDGTPKQFFNHRKDQS